MKGKGNLQEKEKEKEKEGQRVSNGHPSLEELKLVCAKTGLPDSDADWLFNKWEGNGWKNNGKPIRSYPHTIAQWKSQGFFPSQKLPDGKPKPKSLGEKSLDQDLAVMRRSLGKHESP
jgi:hypothetical protein